MSDLAKRIEELEGPRFALEQEIFRVVNPQATAQSKPPAYTASLDAAMSLVPEGWGFRFGELFWVKTDSGEIKSCAKGGVAEMLATDVLSIGKAATPALALCAAAIRARESESE